MLQCILDCYPVRGVEDEELLDQVIELLVDTVCRRYDLLQGTKIIDFSEDEILSLTDNARHALTSFRLCLVALGFGQSSLLPSLKYSGLCLAPDLAKLSGILPITCSIMARCSRLSCV